MATAPFDPDAFDPDAFDTGDGTDIGTVTVSDWLAATCALSDRGFGSCSVSDGPVN